jgi:hypothetical protein
MSHAGGTSRPEPKAPSASLPTRGSWLGRGSWLRASGPRSGSGADPGSGPESGSGASARASPPCAPAVALAQRRILC